MTDMGLHSLPNGHRGDDGAAADTAVLDAPPVFRVQRFGPVSPWPLPLAVPPAAAQVPAVTQWRDGDTLIRWLTAVAVLLVAGIAATVSFVHIQHLAVTHGQTPLASALLPLSIDGTVAATSLAMLRAARAGLATPALARFGLALSVTATLAANVGYGLPFGVTGALISGWPAVAFIVCAELAISMVRRMRDSDSGSGKLDDSTATAAPAATVPDMHGGNGNDSDKKGAAPPRRQPPRQRPQAKRKPASGSDMARGILKDMTGPLSKAGKADVARRAGVSVRTVERTWNELAAAAPADPQARSDQ